MMPTPIPAPIETSPAPTPRAIALPASVTPASVTPCAASWARGINARSISLILLFCVLVVSAFRCPRGYVSKESNVEVEQADVVRDLLDYEDRRLAREGNRFGAGGQPAGEIAD